MVVKIHTPKSYAANKGSSSNLIEYLEKENRDREIMEKEHFFNQWHDRISGAKAERLLDNNKGRLSKDESKFYMLTINPSKREMDHIGGDRDRLKSYVNDVMDTYAHQFNRYYKDGSQLTGENLVYFAKIENQRTYKHNEKRYAEAFTKNRQIDKIIWELDKEKGNEKQIESLKRSYIRNGEGTIIKEGNLKDGHNVHVHIVVHRYDQHQKFKLSPLSNAKNTKNQEVGKEGERKKVKAGFNRDEFVQKCETLFDKKFEYKRGRKESYEYYKTPGMVLSAVSNPSTFAKITAKRAILEMIRDKTLQKHLDMATSNPKYIPKKVLRSLEKLAVKEILKSMDAAAYTNPVTASLNVAKKIITISAKTLSKGMGI